MKALHHALVPVLLLLLLTSAEAAVVVVPSGSVDEIDDAIQQAGAGGTVILESGTHLVTATVVVDLDSVTVIGRKGATILGRGAGLGIRLVLFRAEDDRFTLERVRIAPHPSHRGDIAVVTVVDRAGITVTRCEAEGITQLVDGGAGPALTVTKNEVFTVDLTEPDPSPSHLAVIRSAGKGDVLIRKNRLEGRRGSGTSGVQILPPLLALHEVEKNHITSYDDGVSGEGLGQASISKNKIRLCTNGINVAQGVVARAWEIRANDVQASVTIGIFVGIGELTEVSSNLVLSAGQDGINLGGVLLKVAHNTCRLHGGRGIYGETTTSRYLRNITKRCGSGLLVVGSGNLLKKNNGSKNIGDGVVSTGGNVKGEGNRGRKNGGVQVSIQ